MFPFSWLTLQMWLNTHLTQLCIVSQTANSGRNIYFFICRSTHAIHFTAISLHQTLWTSQKFGLRTGLDGNCIMCMIIVLLLLNLTCVTVPNIVSVSIVCWLKIDLRDFPFDLSNMWSKTSPDVSFLWGDLFWSFLLKRDKLDWNL